MSLAGIIQSVITRCTVLRSSGASKLQTVQIETVDGATPTVEMFEPLGLTSRPAAGAEGLAVQIGGTSHTVAVSVTDRRLRPTDLSPGDTSLYSAHDASVRLSSSGTTISGPKLDAPTVHTPGIVAGGQTGLTKIVYPASVLGLEFVGGVLVRIIPKV